MLDETPEAAVERLARAKAAAVAVRERTLPVLAADTVVVAGGTILGKPGSDAEASDMLRRLSGRSDYPLSLILLEAAGNLVGPQALWKSRQRVRREGPSGAGEAAK